MVLRPGTETRFVRAMVILSGLCLGLWAGRVASTGSLHYAFIPENLVLAWASFLFAWWLKTNLQSQVWSRWNNIILTVLWLVFLPNSWYVITDLIHVPASGQISQLYDV